MWDSFVRNFCTFINLANKLKIFPVESCRGANEDSATNNCVKCSASGWAFLSWFIVLLKAVHQTGICIAGHVHESRERKNMVVDTFWLIFYWGVVVIQGHMLRTRREKTYCLNMLLHYVLKFGKVLTGIY